MIINKLLKITLLFFTSFIALSNPVFAEEKQSSCRPVLHSDLLLDDQNLIIKNKSITYYIDPKGNINNGLKSIELNENQQELLTNYQQKLRQDLPFMKQYMTKEITNVWSVFDKLFAKELGEQSALRLELNKFHTKLHQDIDKAYTVENDNVRLLHKELVTAVNEFDKAIPKFISSVAHSSFKDILKISAGQNNRMKFIANKVMVLQEQFINDVKTQRKKAGEVRKNVCDIFSAWQEKEKQINQLIPELAKLKVVSFEKKN